VVLWALILVGVGFAAKPVSRVVKRWHARRLAAEAEAALVRNDSATAREKAKAALFFSRVEPVVLRASVRVLAQATNAEALHYWQLLEQSGQLTQKDRQECVELAVRTGVWKVAVRRINELLEAAPDNSTNLWLGSQIFVATGDREKALEYAERAAKADPANRRYQLFLWSVRCSDPRPEMRETARAALMQLAYGRDDFGWQALEFLAEDKDMSPERLRELLTLAAQDPVARPGKDLVELGIKLRVMPEARERLLEEMVQQHKKAAPERRCAAGIWLIQKGEAQAAIQLLPLDESLRRKDYFLVHVDALAALGRWEEIAQIMNGQVPLEPVYVKAFQARCSDQLKDHGASELNWHASFTAARGDAEQMLWLADYALKNGALTTAKKALHEIVRVAKDKRSVYSVLINLTEKTGDARELRDLIAEMRRYWPEDDSIRSDYIYLNLLLGESIAEMKLEAEAFAAKSPENLAACTALALAYYRQQELQAAYTVYKEHKLDWSKALPSQQAVYVAVLLANGKTNEVQAIMRLILPNQLRVQEKDLIRMAR
jgi:Tfp pilus assembly protein PilF